MLTAVNLGINIIALGTVCYMRQLSWLTPAYGSVFIVAQQ